MHERYVVTFTFVIWSVFLRKAYMSLESNIRNYKVGVEGEGTEEKNEPFDFERGSLAAKRDCEEFSA